MTREQAVAKLRRLYGQKFYWSVGRSVTSPEKRLEAREGRQAARERIAAIDAEIGERLKQLEWYQLLIAEKRGLRKEEDRLTGEMMHYKFTVGRSLGWANEVTGSGDTWEEAIAQAEAKNAKAS